MNKSVLQKIGVIIMGILLSGSVGFNISSFKVKSNVDVTKIVVDQFEKSVIKVIKTEVPLMIKPMADDVSDLKDGLADLTQGGIDDKTGRAISAYSKVFTIDDLKNSPEKRFSIAQGLEIPSCYETLINIDHDRTILFYNYLIKGLI